MDAINLMTYQALLHGIRNVGGYMTDPIGKCLRSTSQRKPCDILLDYVGSQTFKAFQRMEKLKCRFDASRAENANLIWIEVPETGELSRPQSVLVDRVSGIIQETRPTGVKRYGFLADVQECLKYSTNDSE